MAHKYLLWGHPPPSSYALYILTCLPYWQMMYSECAPQLLRFSYHMTGKSAQAYDRFANYSRLRHSTGTQTTILHKVFHDGGRRHLRAATRPAVPWRLRRLTQVASKDGGWEERGCFGEMLEVDCFRCGVPRPGRTNMLTSTGSRCITARTNCPFQICHRKEGRNPSHTASDRTNLGSRVATLCSIHILTREVLVFKA